MQFHPSCTYEDFFEGFRPRQADGGTGALTFELTPGPFRLFAEAAKANPTTAYILIIDEINRANPAGCLTSSTPGWVMPTWRSDRPT